MKRDNTGQAKEDITGYSLSLFITLITKVRFYTFDPSLILYWLLLNVKDAMIQLKTLFLYTVLYLETYNVRSCSSINSPIEVCLNSPISRTFHRLYNTSLFSSSLQRIISCNFSVLSANFHLLKFF